MSMYPRETSRPSRNEYDGEPFFCVKCHRRLAAERGQKSGSCLMHKTCEFETREAAMERRAHWLLKAEFDRPNAQEQWERDRGPYGYGR